MEWEENDHRWTKGRSSVGGRVQGRTRTSVLGLFRADGFQLRCGLRDHCLAPRSCRAPAAAVGAAAHTTWAAGTTTREVQMGRKSLWVRARWARITVFLPTSWDIESSRGSLVNRSIHYHHHHHHHQSSLSSCCHSSRLGNVLGFYIHFSLSSSYKHLKEGGITPPERRKLSLSNMHNTISGPERGRKALLSFLFV